MYSDILLIKSPEGKREQFTISFFFSYSVKDVLKLFLDMAWEDNILVVPVQSYLPKRSHNCFGLVFLCGEVCSEVILRQQGEHFLLECSCCLLAFRITFRTPLRY